jgi:hypothetical protein
MRPLNEARVDQRAKSHPTGIQAVQARVVLAREEQVAGEGEGEELPPRRRRECPQVGLEGFLALSIAAVGTEGPPIALLESLAVSTTGGVFPGGGPIAQDQHLGENGVVRVRESVREELDLGGNPLERGRLSTGYQVGMVGYFLDRRAIELVRIGDGEGVLGLSRNWVGFELRSNRSNGSD